MSALVDTFRTMPLTQVAFWSIASNILIFALAVLLGELLVYLYRSRRIAPEAEPLSRKEVLLSVGCVFLNSAVMVVGVVLLQRGYIEIVEPTSWWRIALDVIVFLAVMDCAMYFLHRVAHIPGIYTIVHQTHHDYENPRPLTLFVLNPFEVLGFGGLWLAVICLYPSTAIGMAIYLAINVAFGTIGHLGVEPFPKNWNKGYTWWISTSTFHARHHSSPGSNYGFYTLLWDYLFGTLDREHS